jgi:hypothetical protein
VGPAGRVPFSPRSGAELVSESAGAAGPVECCDGRSSVGGPVVNQDRQQKEKAQKTRCQCRRIAWNEAPGIQAR